MTSQAWKDESGGTLVMMVVVLAALLGMMALAIDLGMGYTAKSEAQRAADASALAAGSAFLDYPPEEAEPFAVARAEEYAQQNTIRNDWIAPSEVDVEFLRDERKVRVWVEREGLPTWFGRVLGFDDIDVQAMAAAQATEAGSSQCLKPIALPDLWEDVDDDANGNRIWDDGEEWVYDPSVEDRYEPYTGSESMDPTGYGSDFRGPSRDFGRQIDIKPQDPNSEYTASPGVFMPWRLPPDEDQEECDNYGGGGSTSSGAATYRQNLCSCNESSIQLGEEYEIQTGNMVGPTAQGVDELISEDPDAWWDPNKNGGRGGIRDSAYGDDGFASPRVVKLALFDPGEIDGSGMQTITFNNFALLFIEDQPTRNDPVTARFMYYADGDGNPGSRTGSLVLDLRLVE